MVNVLLKKWLTGISIPQEYVCLGSYSLHQPLSVSVTIRGKNEFSDISRKHLFLGYKPVVMALIFDGNEGIGLPEDEICLHFHQEEFRINSTWKGFATDRACVGRLVLEPITSKLLDGQKVLFYRGIIGKHAFISPIHQRINAYREQFRKKPAGNVQLASNLYDQVRIAYSIPRVISLITVFDGQFMNLFPTDLHGAIGENFYAGSLRIGGEACNQVAEHRKIVISEIEVSQFRQAYALGKQHMKPMSSPANFNLNQEFSIMFKYPLPWGVLRYRELEVVDHVDVGIHRIFIYKTIHTQAMKDSNTLAHIHHFYAQWRASKKLRTDYLLR
jgi:hypothetical protein